MQAGAEIFRPEHLQQEIEPPKEADKAELQPHSRDVFVALLRDVLSANTDKGDTKEAALQLIKDEIRLHNGLGTKINAAFFFGIVSEHIDRYIHGQGTFEDIEAFTSSHLYPPQEVSNNLPVAQEEASGVSEKTPVRYVDPNPTAKGHDTFEGPGAEEIAREKAITDAVWYHDVRERINKQVVLHDSLEALRHHRISVDTAFTAIYDTRVQDTVGTDPRLRIIAAKIFLPYLLSYVELGPKNNDMLTYFETLERDPKNKNIEPAYEYSSIQVEVEEQMLELLERFTKDPAAVILEFYHNRHLDIEDIKEASNIFNPPVTKEETTKHTTEALAETQEMRAWKEKINVQIQASRILVHLREGSIPVQGALTFFQDLICDGKPNPTLHEYLRRLFTPLLGEFQQGRVDQNTLIGDVCFYRTLVAQQHGETSPQREVAAGPVVTGEYVVNQLTSQEITVPEAVALVKARLQRHLPTQGKAAQARITVEKIVDTLIQPVLADVKAGKTTQEVAVAELRRYEDMVRPYEEEWAAAA